MTSEDPETSFLLCGTVLMTEAHVITHCTQMLSSEVKCTYVLPKYTYQDQWTMYEGFWILVLAIAKSATQECAARSRTDN